MFKLTAVRKIWWPVVVQVPDDGGKVQKFEFDAEFEIPSLDEHDEFTGAGGDALKRWMTGNVKRVKTEDGVEDEPNGEATKAKLLSIAHVRNGLLAAFYQAYNGRAAARKN
jgi:hypothetical protein